ncbi:glycosyltransferase family 4 protein [Novosphingobium sediminicola]|uniref:Glycosyltransferase involved in cell wall biosynthesis n=1 Tax=Novosphingobium sediminicola TaxID=563162 RepID=A0A7W6CPL8_9SPHN|nr:glycosyltransferase family 4 protein [Novosphingobium sediminicola]MBB3956826.1 glycosyltransferase involved in cell wall biosynthesis [Novosphingobium sediminicola]
MKRLLIVHNAGDYREAYRRRSQDGSEIYYGHGYVLDQMTYLAQRHGEAAFLCCHAPSYVETIEGGVTLMGANTDGVRRPAPVLQMIAEYAPTHLIVHGPMNPLLRWGLKQGLRVGCILADSFSMHPLDRWFRFGRLAGLLNDPGVTLVGNHGVNASRSLVKLGVRPEKVVAWDFPQTRRPDQWPVKTDPGTAPHDLLYVGSIGRRKGIGDVIDAMALLRHRPDIRLKVAGIGQQARFEARARRKGVADRIEFLGLVPNRQVMNLMHASAAVIVPSRHSFPEGIPLTLYEALASRTPVIASDHPMFAGHIKHECGALVFPAGNSALLAQQIERLLSDNVLYSHISQGAAQAWQRMQIPIKWGELIDHWMNDDESDRIWMSKNALSQTT